MPADSNEPALSQQIITKMAEPSPTILAFPANSLMRTAALTQLDFRSAAEAWLETRRHHLSPRTFLDYGNYIKTLTLFFREMRLPEIDGDQVRAYQRSRRVRCGAGIINKECGVLVMMRERIGMPLADYQRLKEPKDYESPGRRLTQEEETKLEQVFRAAADVPKWAAAGLTSLLSMKSGCGPGEIRSLRLKDCTLDPPQIVIPLRGAKNQRRQRPVPLNDTAAWALERLLDRAVGTCSCRDPEHYLIPFRRRDRSFDPTQSCSEDGWRTAQRQLFNLAGVKLRPYDFRHHAVSVAISNPQVTRGFQGENCSYQTAATTNLNFSPVAANVDCDSFAPGDNSCTPYIHTAISIIITSVGTTLLDDTQECDCDDEGERNFNQKYTITSSNRNSPATTIGWFGIESLLFGNYEWPNSVMAQWCTSEVTPDISGDG
jgi:integrase